MARSIGAVLAGVVVVGVVVASLQYAGTLIHPPPEGLDPFDPADASAFAEYVAGLPPLNWALTFGSEVLGAFLGAVVAGKIAAHHKTLFAGAIVVLAVAGSINNWISFTHPVWFIAGQLVAYPLVFLAVSRLFRGSEPPAP